MNYQVYNPSAALQPFVKCFWTLEDNGSEKGQKQRIVPDGCMEMIFHFGDLYCQYFENGSSIIQPRSFIFGQITHFIEIAPTGRSGIISARFLPEGLQPFLDLPVTALENRAVSLVDLFGEIGSQLEQHVAAGGDHARRIEIIEAFLLSRLQQPQTIDMVVKNCVEVIIRSQGKLGVVELAEKMNIRRRNMERKFNAAIGMSPKQLSRVVRLQATLRMLEQNQFTSLTSLAYENGYYDQAHFIRDFKEFTGSTPKSFFAENLKLAAIFASAE